MCFTLSHPSPTADPMDKGNQNAVAAMSAALGRMGSAVETARAGQAAHLRAHPQDAAAAAGGLHLAAGPESSSLSAAGPSSAAAAARVDLMSRVQQPGPAVAHQNTGDALAREFQALHMHQTPAATATAVGPRSFGVTATAGPMPVMGSSGHELQRRQALAAQQQQHHLQIQQLQHQQQQQQQLQQQMQLQHMAAQQQQQMQQMQQTQLMLQMQQQQQMQAQIAATAAAQQHAQQQQQQGAEKASSRLFATMRAQQPELDAAAAAAPAVAPAGQNGMFGPGLNAAALPELLQSGNEKWKNSEFLQFLNKVSSGELQLGEDGIKAAGEAAAEAAGGVEESDLAYNSLFGDGEEEDDDEEARLMEKEEAEFIQNLQNGGEMYVYWSFFLLSLCELD